MALIDKGSLLMVPSTYEQEKLYNVLPSGNRAPDSTDQNSGYDQTRADFSFDRGSNAAATRIGSDGLIKKYRENILTESNNFSDSDWTKNVISSVTTGHEGYDGSNDAWLVTKSNATAYVNLQQLVSSTGVQTFSVYAKAGTLNGFGILAGGGTDPFVDVDLSSGTIRSSRSSVIDKKIEDVENGWYRISMVFNETTTGVYIYPDWNLTNTGNIYIQNAQLESGLVSTDYLDSGATTGKAGVLIDLPRINYDANGENGALLLEPSRANLVTRSEYFLGWSFVNATKTDNYGISPEGVKNSTRIVFDGASNYMYLGFSGTNVGTYSSTIYIKGTDGETIVFGKGTNVAAGPLHTLNGDWQRIEHISTDAGNTLHISTFKGATARDIEIFGAQLEEGSYPTSYIPNHGESGGVTRAADSCNGSEDSSLFNDSAMSLFLDLPSTGQETGIKEITISDGTADNRFNIYAVTSNQLRTSLVSGGSVILNYVVSDITTNQNLKILISYSGSTYKVFVNGELELNTTMPTPPTGLNVFDFSNATGSSLFYGKVKQAAVFTEALTDAEAITLTTL